MKVFMLHCWEEIQDVSGNLNEIIRVFQDAELAKDVVMSLFNECFLNLKTDSNITIMAAEMDLYDNPKVSIMYARNGVMGTSKTFTYLIRVQPISIE